MVAICADPVQAPLPGEIFQIFVIEFLRSIPGEYKRDPYTSHSINRLARLNSASSGGKVALHTLINVCALQGISVRDLLLCPKEAASAPLRGGLGAYSPLARYSDNALDQGEIMRICLASLLSDSYLPYIPKPSRVAEEIDSSAPVTLGRGSHLYREYLQAYRKQGSRKALIESDGDFEAAMDCMKVLRPNPFGSYDGKASRYAVSRATGKSLDEARHLVSSVTRCRRVVELAKAEVLGLTPAELRAQKKIGTLQLWPDTPAANRPAQV